MVNVTSFRDAETGQIMTKIVMWNFSDVASGTILNASKYHSEKLLL